MTKLEEIRQNMVGKIVVSAKQLSPEGALELGRPETYYLVLELDDGMLAMLPVDGDMNREITK